MALSEKRTFHKLEKGAGSQFNLRVMRVFLQLMGVRARSAPRPPCCRAALGR